MWLEVATGHLRGGHATSGERRSWLRVCVRAQPSLELNS